MFGYKDYYDEKLNNTPYAAPREEREDWLRLVDMLLEHYIDARANSSEGLIFSRGMKMTEAETESYFFTAPRERVSIGFDSKFAEDVGSALAHIEGRTDATPDDTMLPVRECARRLALSDTERLALVVAMSVQADMKYPRLYGYISGEPSMQYPTAGVYMALRETFDDEGAEAAVSEILDARGSFYRHCLDGAVLREKKRPYLHTPLVLSPAALRFLQGRECRYTHRDDGGTGLPESYRRMAERLARIKGGGYYYLECRDPFDAAEILGSCEDAPLYIIDMDDMAGTTDSDADAIGDMLSDRIAEAMLYDRRIAIRSTDAERLCSYRDILDTDRAVWLYGESEMPRALLDSGRGMSAAPIEIAIPDTGERLRIWETMLENTQLDIADDIACELLAETYAFSYSRIKEIIREAALLCEANGLGQLDRETLLSVIFRYNTADFGGLATRIHTAYVWDDMEIAPSQKRRLIVACDRYRLRGRIDEKYGVARKNAYGNGVSVLMYGAPGTGKTMAAQVVANELGLPLYRVDVSQIFSKYVGETQKNLGIIFDEAKKANVILFFDEADALFAKRTEVGDANDRYANSETAYLLQKIEEYDGMTILATNLYHNFDSAFLRRMTYVAHIDSPDEATRFRLWQRILPDTMPVSADVDYYFLAERFELSGSSIKSILHSAAYMAGAADRAITMADIVLSLKYELEKLGRIIDSSDFANYGVYLQE